MGGNDFWLLGTIILGITLAGWLVLDWFENNQQWESYDLDATSNRAYGLSSGERSPDALDIEAELLLCYPLDPFAPTILWRPHPHDEWLEAQEAEQTAGAVESPPVYQPVHT